MEGVNGVGAVQLTVSALWAPHTIKADFMRVSSLRVEYARHLLVAMMRMLVWRKRERQREKERERERERENKGGRER